MSIDKWVRWKWSKVKKIRDDYLRFYQPLRLLLLDSYLSFNIFTSLYQREEKSSSFIYFYCKRILCTSFDDFFQNNMELNHSTRRFKENRQRNIMDLIFTFPLYSLHSIWRYAVVNKLETYDMQTNLSVKNYTSFNLDYWINIQGAWGGRVGGGFAKVWLPNLRASG